MPVEEAVKGESGGKHGHGSEEGWRAAILLYPPLGNSSQRSWLPLSHHGYCMVSGTIEEGMGPTIGCLGLPWKTALGHALFPGDPHPLSFSSLQEYWSKDGRPTPLPGWLCPRSPVGGAGFPLKPPVPMEP